MLVEKLGRDYAGNNRANYARLVNKNIGRVAFSPEKGNNIASVINCNREAYFVIANVFLDRFRRIVPIYANNHKLFFVGIISLDEVRQLLTAAFSVNRPKID